VFSFRLSRQHKLYNKIPIFFSDHPIVYTGNLTTNKSKAHTEVHTIVLAHDEDGEGDRHQHHSWHPSGRCWLLMEWQTPFRGVNQLCLAGPERPHIRVPEVILSTMVNLCIFAHWPKHDLMAVFRFWRMLAASATSTLTSGTGVMLDIQWAKKLIDKVSNSACGSNYSPGNQAKPVGNFGSKHDRWR